MHTTASALERLRLLLRGRRRAIYLAILLVVALGTRLWQLDVLPYGHNNDETRMALDGYLLLDQLEYRPLISLSRESTFPYVYGLLIKEFGFSNAVIRYPSALLGVVGCLCLCLLVFRILPDFWAFLVGLTIVTYGPYLALDRLALRTSLCTAVVFAFLLFYFVFRSSELRLHWFFLGFVFGAGFHTYNAYRVMPLLVAVLFVIHFWQPSERIRLGRKLAFFGLGGAVGGFNVIYLVLSSSPDAYLWREADVFGQVVRSDAGLLGTLAHNIGELSAILLGADFPHPVGAEVGDFHILWVPLLIIGVLFAIHASPRSEHFALLITMFVFLLPGLLSTEMFLRRILTSLVLIVALTGIGLAESVRRVNLDRDHLVRAFAVILAVCVSTWNLWAYFVEYATEPKWSQGPFFASHRMVGPILERYVTVNTAVIFAGEIEDPWMLEVYIADAIFKAGKIESFYRIEHPPYENDIAQARELCAENDSAVLLYRADMPEDVIDQIKEVCGLTEQVSIDWPEGVIHVPKRQLVLLKTPD